MHDVDALIRQLADEHDARLDLWAAFVDAVGAEAIAEVGVYRGEFAEHLLRACPAVERYYMIDPWRHLDDWEKPANVEDDEFERYMTETMRRTEFAAGRRVVLRGRTTEVADRIEDGSLDLAYVDGDHTLRGIAIDLIRVWPKVKVGGFVGGDDLARSIWQHAREFEPTLVFPFAVHFAEAVGARMWAFAPGQYLIEKRAEDAFEFNDLTGEYDELGLRGQMGGRG